jgi:hypothetical protein
LLNFNYREAARGRLPAGFDLGSNDA